MTTCIYTMFKKELTSRKKKKVSKNLPQDCKEKTFKYDIV